MFNLLTVLRSLWITLLFSPTLLAQTSPNVLYGELFHAVQMAPVFEDSKTFTDCIPQDSPEQILAAYEAARTVPGFDLKTFVLKHFKLPRTPTSSFETDTSNTVQEHIERLWPVLTRDPTRQPQRGSLIPLPYPYVVPGGRFREVYYWDSYFTMLGLQINQRDDLIADMVNNFAYLIDTIGFIPNGNRTYYLSRSQPPFFSLMVRLLADIQGDSILTKFLPQLEQEYDFWMDGKARLTGKSTVKQAYRRVVQPDKGVYLNRYWDDRPVPRPESYREDYLLAQALDTVEQKALYRNLRAAAESGWDFSSRWFRDGKTLASIRTTELIPVDLNCLLYHLEETLAQAHGATGKAQRQRYYQRLAQERKEAIQRYCWNEAQGFYYDYDFMLKQSSPQVTLAAAAPLFFQIASPDQAQKVKQGLEKNFLRPGGLLTTLEATGQQWDAPNGWPPLQWMAVKGLMNYDHDSLAQIIRQRWIDNNVRVYRNTGRMVEKYNVVNTKLRAGGGEYPVQDGFGWSNGVLLKLMQRK